MEFFGKRTDKGRNGWGCWILVYGIEFLNPSDVEDV